MRKQDQAAKIAARIAKDLFTVGGINKRFTHLRASNYNPDTKQFDEIGCGWSEACAADLIAKHIRNTWTRAIKAAVRKERERCVGIVQQSRGTGEMGKYERAYMCDAIAEKIRKGKA